MSKTCLCCGKDFEPTNNRQAYCNEKCWWKASGTVTRKSKRQAHKRKCLHCKIEYTTTDSRKVYCSLECKIAYNNNQRATPHKGKTGVCEVCGKDYVVARNPTKRTCSERCARFKCKYDGNRLKALARDSFTCRLCGKSKGQHLEVHHIDCTGQTENPNHDIQNLVTLCNGCHQRLHAGIRATGKMVVFTDSECQMAQ